MLRGQKVKLAALARVVARMGPGRRAEAGSDASSGIVDRSLQRKRRPNEAASLLLTGGWLMSSNADKEVALCS